MNVGMTLANQKNVFVVLGMARSGTSVVSRGLKALGIDLGNQFRPSEKAPWNPKGSWEDYEIVYKINEKVFSALNYTWDTLQFIDQDAQQKESLLPIKKTANSILAQRFNHTNYWGFKDPRTVKILPFWQSVFSEMNINEHYIIVLRNPLGSAQSYHRLTGSDVEHGLLLWLTHLLPALEGTQGKPRVLVSYELLMANPIAELERIKQSLRIPIATDPKAMDEYINSFLEKSLLHFEFSASEAASHPAIKIAPLCIKLYEFLLKVAQDEIPIDDPRCDAHLQEIKQDFLQAMPIYHYIDSLLRQNKEQKTYIRSLHKSRLWKMIYPLRKLDTAFRHYRKRSNEK